MSIANGPQARTCKVLYLAGCGRSGTTILGFCLGNALRHLDLGEVIDFAKFEGRPNGFGPGTENHEFWRRVRTRVEVAPAWVGFARFRQLQRRFDRHAALPLLMLPARCLVAFGLRQYHDGLRLIYGALLEESQGRVCIDSSKYPSRLWHLAKVLPAEQLAVVHLVRDPFSVVQAFLDGQQGRPRARLATLGYHLVINGVTALLMSRMGPRRRTKIRYEDVTARPEQTLARMAADLGLDLSEAIHRIAAGLPLRRGFPMNGNRMRLQPEITFRRSDGADPAPRGSLLVALVRRLVY